jgi:ABC-type transport system involved in multi-copper enzyme maturation permease subunit
MSMGPHVAPLVVARMSVTRMLRGKTVYVTALLGFVPMLFALTDSGRSPKGAWHSAIEGAIRFVVPFAAAMQVSGAVSEELEQKTFTYLWSRPIHRSAIILGRLLAMVPMIFALTALSVLAAFPFVKNVSAGELVRVLAAMGATTIGFSFFAIGGGALFPRQPLLFTLGLSLTLEQFLFAFPGVRHISIVSHARVLAGLADEPDAPTVNSALVGMAVVSAAWLAIGIYRVMIAEFAAAKES